MQLIRNITFEENTLRRHKSFRNVSKKKKKKKLESEIRRSREIVDMFEKLAMGDEQRNLIARVGVIIKTNDD